jgi:hypothetical protein
MTLLNWFHLLWSISAYNQQGVVLSRYLLGTPNEKALANL